MRANVLLRPVIGFVIAIAFAGSQRTAAADDTKKLEGTWILVSGEIDGRAISGDDLKDHKLTVVGNTHTVKVGDKAFKGTHTLDATKTPKQMDVVDFEGPHKGLDYGIYEFNGNDAFRVCFAPTDDKGRPTEFATKPGTGVYIHLWQRLKE